MTSYWFLVIKLTKIFEICLTYVDIYRILSFKKFFNIKNLISSDFAPYITHGLANSPFYHNNGSFIAKEITTFWGHLCVYLTYVG